MQLNPILIREVRARWRRWPAFATVFGYTVFLAVVVGWRYADFHARAKTLSYVDQRGAALGHELFVALSIAQVIGWLCLAPVLTVTGLAGERDQGLLDAVQLSGLSAPEIIRGKLLSALAFVGLMLLAPLPIIAVCFLLGGVSPFEFICVALLQFMTALTAASIGLNCAAWNQQRGVAFAKTCGGLLVWHICPCGFASPLYAVFMLTDGVSAFNLGTIALLQVPLGLSACIAWYCLAAAKRGLLQLPSEKWTETRHYAFTYNPALAGQTFTVTYTARRVPLPFVARLKFANPVLQREILSKLRLRHMVSDAHPIAEDGTLFFWGLLALPATIFCFITNYACYWFVAYVWLFAIVLVATGLSAVTLAGEREAHAWEALRLTSLSLWDIIIGKLGATLFICGYYSLPVLFLLIASALSATINPEAQHAISWHQFSGVLLLVGASTWCWATFGLFVSWFCKRAWIAVCWALAILLLALLLMPMLFNPLPNTAQYNFLHVWHPWLALNNYENPLPLIGIAHRDRLSILILMVNGVVWLALLYGAMWLSARRARMKLKTLR